MSPGALHTPRSLNWLLVLHYVTPKVICPGSYDDLLKTAMMNQQQQTCDTTNGGCGIPNPTKYILAGAPDIFVLDLSWDGNEAADLISSTMQCLSTKIDIGDVYSGVSQGSEHSLVSLVC